jgi:hypothetical protein
MDAIADSNARCIRAVELTFRFLLTCFWPLGFLLVAVCLLFEKGYKPGLNTFVAIVCVYFTVAHNCYGRNKKASQIIDGLSGLHVRTALAGGCGAHDDVCSNPAFNPATGLMMMGDFDTNGNLYGFGTISGGISGEDASMFDDNHHSFNPANGLPMLDDSIDVHGNMYCTNSMDDLMDYSSSIFDDSITHSSFDDSFNSGSFDDDWNK